MHVVCAAFISHTKPNIRNLVWTFYMHKYLGKKSERRTRAILQTSVLGNFHSKGNNLFSLPLALAFGPSARCVVHILLAGKLSGVGYIVPMHCCQQAISLKESSHNCGPMTCSCHRVRCPSVLSSANVLWFLESSSDHCNPKTKWQNACLGHQPRQMYLLGTGLHGFLGEPKNTNLTMIWDCKAESTCW